MKTTIFSSLVGVIVAAKAHNKSFGLKGNKFTFYRTNTFTFAVNKKSISN